MRGATSQEILTPEAEGYMCVPANNHQGYIDILCHYSPLFTSTLIVDNGVVKATKHPKDYSGIKLKKLTLLKMFWRNCVL